MKKEERAEALTNPELLEALGTHLFGPHWMRPMAEALQVSYRTVYRWRNGERGRRWPVPGGKWIALAEICEERNHTRGYLKVAMAEVLRAAAPKPKPPDRRFKVVDEGGLNELRTDRQRQARALRKTGKTWTEVGEALGVSRKRAQQLAYPAASRLRSARRGKAGPTAQ